jgi:adenosylmethionine-8-amino-7-oxononanoate aminotransferase
VRDIVCLGPPFVITTDEVEIMVNVLRQAVDEVCD